MREILIYTLSTMLIITIISFFYCIWQFIFFIFNKEKTIKNIVFWIRWFSLNLFLIWILPYALQFFNIKIELKEILIETINIIEKFIYIT